MYLSGVKADGSIKVRAVDDFTESMCNPCTKPTEKLRCDTLDLFFDVLRGLSKRLGIAVPLSMFKADIDAAFRRIPLLPEHRRFAYVAFLVENRIVIAGHAAMPFGSIASVHHWDRVGSLLCAIARRVLKIPMLRYVDDFFAADRRESADKAMGIFARLVRCCLGQSAVAKDKLECGNPLTILGIRVTLCGEGVIFWPDDKKVVKWTGQIESYLALSRLTEGEASKLTGALQWGTQKMFNRIGRAMLRPLIRSVGVVRLLVFVGVAIFHRNDNWKRTALALRWWLEVLRLQIKERRPWVAKGDKPLHLFCDARSTPPRVAAVLFGSRPLFVLPGMCKSSSVVVAVAGASSRCFAT